MCRTRSRRCSNCSASLSAAGAARGGEVAFGALDSGAGLPAMARGEAAKLLCPRQVSEHGDQAVWGFRLSYGCSDEQQFGVGAGGVFGETAQLLGVELVGVHIGRRPVGRYWTRRSPRSSPGSANPTPTVNAGRNRRTAA